MSNHPGGGYNGRPMRQYGNRVVLLQQTCMYGMATWQEISKSRRVFQASAIWRSRWPGWQVDLHAIYSRTIRFSSVMKAGSSSGNWPTAPDSLFFISARIRRG